MHSKLAGHLPLQEMIAQTIESAHQKMAAVDEGDKAKKLLAYEKKEHGGKIPSVKDEEKEKKSSAIIDAGNPDDIEKLASALDEMADEFLKEADKVELGGEKPQGGTVLPTAVPPSGTQSYKKDSAKKFHPEKPSQTLVARKETGPAATAVEDTQVKPPVPLTSKYPTKGVLKTAAESVKDLIAKKKDEKSGDEKKPGAGDFAFKAKAEKKEKDEDESKEKKSSAVGFILSKIAESSQGGMTLDTPTGQGPKPSDTTTGGNNARKALETNQSAIGMKKVDGKSPQKKMLSEVLSEPAQTKSTDSKLQDNLRNTGKAGVKIAAAKAYLAKIAADPSDPRHEALKAAIAKKKAEKSGSKDEGKEQEKKSNSNAGYGAGLPPVATPTPNPM